jgi:deoxycytidine triphosphate deaminase
MESKKSSKILSDEATFLSAAKRSSESFEMMPGGVLSDSAIERGLKDGSIFISPFSRSNLTNCAYDISLGSRVVFIPAAAPVVNAGWITSSTETPTIDVTNKTSVATSFKRLELAPDAKGVTIPPNSFAVCHSHEFIGTTFHPYNHITTMMRARSTLARAGISISPSAGWGDVGFANRWGMIIHNNRSDANVFIPFGAKVAQIVFLRVVGRPSKSYATASGTYKTVSGKRSFEKLDEEWDASSLLPSAEAS